MPPSPGLAGGTAAYPGFTPRKDANPNGVVAWVPRSPGGLGRPGSY
ncbi:hypothetical protein BH23VER1_BH23VER1_10970 [soil metagenome]